jgi:hypothetical protein
MVVATPLALGLWIYARWREGDLQLMRETLVLVGTIGWMLILVAAFAAPLPATLLVPPIGILAGGIWLWISRPRGRFARAGAVLAIALGSLGVLSGGLRLLLASI